MVDFLRKIGDALIDTQYPFGSLAPIDRQQTIGSSLMSLGGNISQAGAQGAGPMAALGSAWGNLNDRGANRAREMLLGEKVKSLRSERERKAKQDEYNRNLFGRRDQGAEPGGYMPTGGGGMDQYRNAISSIESGGNYQAVGPTHSKLGRALGRYQVMEANVGPWTEEALGRRMSPEEFLASPEAQDAVFDYKFGSYVERYGDPEKAAQAWFAGPGGVGKTNRRDALGTTVGDYTSKFASALGGGGQQQPYQVAQAGGGVTPAPSGGPTGSPLDNMPLDQLYNLQAQAQVTDNAPLAEAVGTIIKSRTEGQTDDIKEYNLYRQQGGDKNFTEWMKDVKRSGATQVNVGPSGVDYGSPPTGWAWARDPEGNVRLDERGAPVAMPIGPELAKRQEAEEAAAAAEEAKGEQTQRYGNVVLEDIGRVKERIRNSPFWTTGLMAQIFQDVGGSEALNTRTLTDTIRANIGFDRLQAMRDASPTGGALGQVTERELGFLQSTLGSLDLAQDDEQLLENLNRLEGIYTQIMRKAAAYPNADEFGFEAPPETLPDDEQIFQGVREKFGKEIREEDIQNTMRKHNMTREEVMQGLWEKINAD